MCAGYSFQTSYSLLSAAGEAGDSATAPAARAALLLLRCDSVAELHGAYSAYFPKDYCVLRGVFC